MNARQTLPRFSRQHYLVIAETLRDKRNCLDSASISDSRRASAMYESFWDTTERICGALYADNPRFNREHFLAVIRGEKELTSRPSRSARKVGA